MAALPEPPSSQHHSGLGYVISSVAQLSDDHKRSCDDLIILLGEHNGTEEQPSNETRDALWKKVFSGGWDTNCTNSHPGPLRPRRGVESMKQVGVFKSNLPQSPAAKKKGSNKISEARMAGAPAFIKPNIKWDDFGVTFVVCDAKGSGAHARHVQYMGGWTVSQARAEAIIHWDYHESERIGHYNLQLVICWARSRLLRSMRTMGTVLNADVTAAGNRPIGTDNEVVERHDELVKLVTCASILQEAAVISAHVEVILRTRVSPQVSLVLA